jgi:hypothetical protein
MKKLLFALAPLLALVAFAMAPSAALAHKDSTLAHKHSTDGPCRILAAWTAEPEKEKCAEPPGVSTTEAQNLREEEVGAPTTPFSTNFPTQGLLVNTKTSLRLSTTIGGVAFRSSSPTGYVFVGLNLTSNPTNSTAACRAATGYIVFVDVQRGSPSAVFNGTTAAPFVAFSDSLACPVAVRSKVFIRELTLLFEQLGPGKAPVTANGTVEAAFSNPNAEKCPAGGVELSVKQPGLTTEPVSEKLEIDNGEAEKAGSLCFVSSNNYLFPKTAPTWAPFTNTTEKEKIGIWSTKEP